MFSAPKPMTYPIRPASPYLAERPEAAQLRITQLEQLPTDVPLVLDLEGLRMLTLSAADELIVSWLMRKRASRRQQGFVVALFSPYSVVHETLEAALREKQLAAYALSRSIDPAEGALEAIGDVTPTNQQTLDVVRTFTGGASTIDIAERLGLAAPAATNRLNELVSKGLVLKLDKVPSPRGRPSARFVYPWRTGVQAAETGVRRRDGAPIPA